MSEMQRNKGIVKRLSTPETTKEVYEKLDNDKKWDEVTDGIPTYIEDNRYEIVNGCIFDVSGAPDITDDYDDINEAVRINDTDYRVHAYYYNGGASFGEMLDQSIPIADAEYNNKKPKDILRKALAESGVTELEAMVLIQSIFEEAK